MAVSDVELAITAAEAGSTMVRSMFRTPLTRHAKSSTDFATDADLQSERVILDILREARPDDQLIGEETGTSQHGSPDRAWLVDQLCGTLNYAAQNPLVAVNVSLLPVKVDLFQLGALSAAVNISNGAPGAGAGNVETKASRDEYRFTLSTAR